ncbi:hypothetical protein [Vibrio sp.]|uniref:hypothetical protein n=1 Tax=Vibrio sp. TaxID=678 RepID=UPI003D0BE1C9
MANLNISKLVIIAAVILLGYLAPEAIHYLQQTSAQPDDQQYCTLSSLPCLQGGVSMQLESDSVAPLRPAELTVDWPGSTTSTLILTLKGREMEMGTVMVQLNQVTEGQYKGTVTLPVCSSEEMTWLGQLTDGDKSVFPAIRMKR